MRVGAIPLSILLTVLPGVALGELQPEQVAILAARSSPQSVEIAEYYAQARGIPLAHICLLDVVPGKDLDRAVWEKTVRPAIRTWILDQRLEGQLRCLATVWDVPLKISGQVEEIDSRRAFFEAERRSRRRAVAEVLSRLGGILPEEETTASVEVSDDADGKKLAELSRSAIDVVQKRIVLAGPAAAESASLRLLECVGELGGVTAGIDILTGRSATSMTPKLEREKPLEFAKGRLLGLRDARTAVEQLPESIERDEQILTIVSSAEGHLGAVEWIERQLHGLEKNETYSSFDSELSLLFWLDYPLNRWQPNLLHYEFDDSALRARKPTLMVSRIEAPTVADTRRLIDDAIATEAAGLRGKVYLDARGIPGPSEPASRGSYGDYDQAIRDLASLLREHTLEQVVLDDKQELFVAGACPDAGLYCGWYSLAQYVDAFDFARGSVGYHIASAEATTLRSAGSQVWCKRMLEDGICATLGPVHEPYLTAFPRPDEFFVALLSGRYSLAECYYRTSPFNSWVMILVGDPLYNPFRAKPGLSAAGLTERYGRLLETAGAREQRPLPKPDAPAKSSTVTQRESDHAAPANLGTGG
ncbi:MAG: TIGR03790 family protein [Thermoguttaceae bacterium]